MGEISFTRYKATDLAVFTLITVLFESLCAFAITKWFPGELYTVSVTFAVVAVVMMRWKYFAAVQAVAGGLALVLVHRAADNGFPAENFAVYTIGNLFALTAIILLKTLGDDRVRKQWYFTVLYVITIYLSIEIGRSLVSLVVGKGFILGSFLLADSVSLVFMTVAVFVTRALDGMFEDQKKYLLRTYEKRREEENA